MEPVDTDDLPVSPVRAALPRLLSLLGAGNRRVRCLGTVGPLQALLTSSLVERLTAKEHAHDEQDRQQRPAILLASRA